MTSKIVSTKIASTIFLAIVLITGTITALSFPSFIIKGVNAQGQPYYGMDSYDDRKSYDKRSYGNDYESQYQSSYKPDYKPKYPSYVKDDRDKSKDSSKSVSINKIKCINDNININGNNTRDINIGNKGADKGYSGAYSSAGGGYGGGEGYNDGYNKKKDKGFDCIINNNNTNTNIGGGGNQTVPPGPTTANLTVTKTTTCDLQEFGDLCNFNPIITVTGNNPTPNPFPASQTPIVVTLGTGQYSVSEAGFVSGLAQCAALGFDGGQQTAQAGVFICTNFSDDCSGDISAGQELSCNIENTVIDTNVPPQTGTLNVTKTVTCTDENGENSPSCAQLLATITEDQFNILVFGNNPTPNQFTGSETGTVVTLGIGSYAVQEASTPSVVADIAALGGNITGPIPSFSGDCVQFFPGATAAAGTISVAGESDTCNIVNHFIIEEEEEDFTVAGLPITTQGTADSSELTASEKIEKLKKQWLDLLP